MYPDVSRCIRFDAIAPTLYLMPDSQAAAHVISASMLKSHPAFALWCDPADGLVARIAREVDVRGLHPARTVVLVPYAQLMAVARQMWTHAAAPGFMPRFETTRNWARSAGGFIAAEDDISFDMGRDLLTARSLLMRAGLGEACAALAPRLVQLALQLAPLAAAQLPGERSAWAVSLRGVLGAGGGCEWFGVETALNAVALAWVGASAYETDALLQGAARRQADALILLEGLQLDPLATRLAQLFDAQVLRLPLTAAAAPLRPARVHAALDPQDEAERAAACVLRHVAAGCAPVALVATDRALTRRISAQLALQGVVMQDETGWKLSTTRAAALLMSALRACAPDAGNDAVLDWLKSAPAFDAAATCALERELRALGLRDWAAWLRHCAREDAQAGAGLRALTQAVQTQRAMLARSRPLAQWREATRTLLQAGGQWEALATDTAGSRVISALGLDDAAYLEPAGSRWTLAEFSGWVRQVLESVSVILTPPTGAAPGVVLLPLSQMLGRPFAAVVVPGCDDQRLPASPDPAGEWSAAQREALGLPLRPALEVMQREAWTAALQAPHVDLLCRNFDTSGEPVRPSPLLQMLRFDGLVQDAPDPRVPVPVASQSVTPPNPCAAELPVTSLSASAYEDLRRCPYRFFALRQLGLRSADELDAEFGKRDFGNWLHAVLAHFHQALQANPEASPDARRALIEQAQARVTRAAEWSDAEFLPFAAVWPAVREGYLEWLAHHEQAEGAQFVESEVKRRLSLGAVALEGRIDRIDRTADGHAFVLDYKTESLERSRERVKDPAEDTQLAFYAALLEDDTLRAAYVNVGESTGTKTVEHKHVVAVRDALIQGIVSDMARIAGGAPMPALGEGAVCGHCEARGLCRKDAWWDAAPGSAQT